MFFMTLVLGEIMLSQPSVIYNLGDNLEISATIKPSQYSSGFFEINLICIEASKNIHREYLTLEAGKEKQISTFLSLSKSFLGGMSGDCNILAEFSAEQEQSQKFKISDKIDLSLNIENMSVKAGDELKIKGNALKENGKLVNGFLELIVENTDIRLTRTVSEGNFEVGFSFPETIKSGNYVLGARVYEKSQGEETNSGETKVTLNIKSTPEKIEIATSKQNVEPGESLIFRPAIYDQATEQVPGEVSIKIYSPSEELFLQKILKSGEDEELIIANDQSPGYWEIKAEALGLEAKRLFYINELEKIKFDIENDTLIITNIGNVHYKKDVQISISDFTEIKNVDLDVGEVKKFRLSAPEGKYNVKVTDGEQELVTEEISLTGRIIGVENVKGSISLSSKYPIVWLFLIAVFGLFIIILVQRVAKKKFYALSPEQPEKEKKSEIITYKDKGKKMPGTAEHSLVLHGNKEKTGIIAVKIKDIDKVRKSSLGTVNNIVREVIDNKGVVYETSDYLIGIFSPVTTKTFGNELIAVKISRQINEILKEHNRKFKDKIDYGISLNSGELIVRKEGGMVRFTSIGNTISLARKIADLANGEVLLSENLQKRVISQIRTEKEARSGINVYHIKDIINRQKHKEFISDFLSRMAMEDKGKKK